MIKLEAGNVLLKPSHRKQLMAWLRRALRLGDRLGDFVLTLTLQRTGKSYVVQAHVRDSLGEFGCRARQSDWRDAIRQIAWDLSMRLRQQSQQQALA